MKNVIVILFLILSLITNTSALPMEEKEGHLPSSDEITPPMQWRSFHSNGNSAERSPSTVGAREDEKEEDDQISSYTDKRLNPSQYNNQKLQQLKNARVRLQQSRSAWKKLLEDANPSKAESDAEKDKLQMLQADSDYKKNLREVEQLEQELGLSPSQDEQQELALSQDEMPETLSVNITPPLTYLPNAKKPNSGSTDNSLFSPSLFPSLKSDLSEEEMSSGRSRASSNSSQGERRPRLTVVTDFLTPIQRVKEEVSSRRSTNWPHRYDALHPARLIPTVIGDTIVSAAVVNYFFKIDPHYGVPAWLIANLIGSVVASHHFRTAVEARSPQFIKSAVKSLLSSTDYWNPGYWSYYTVAWSIMGRDPSFNVTLPEAASFMLVSGMLRQQANLWINKRNPCITNDPHLWNETNIQAIVSNPRNQYYRATWEYAPDVIGAFCRSGASNVWSSYQAKEPVQAILPKSAWSALVYSGGLLGYYALHRCIEHGVHCCYRQGAFGDQKRLENLYIRIQRAANFGVTGKVVPTSSLLQAAEEGTGRGERQALLQNWKLGSRNGYTTPDRSSTPFNRGLSRSFSSKKYKPTPVDIGTLKKSLKVLQSHLINLFKDPLFYRMPFCSQKMPEHIERAYKTLDLLEMYKAHITSLENFGNDLEKAKTASKAFIDAVTELSKEVDSSQSFHQQNGIELAHTSPFRISNQQSAENLSDETIPVAYRNLLDLFSYYSGIHPHESPNPSINGYTPIRTPDRNAQDSESSDDSDSDGEPFHGGV